MSRQHERRSIPAEHRMNDDLPDEALIELRWRWAQGADFWLLWVLLFVPAGLGIVFGDDRNGLHSTGYIVIALLLAAIPVALTAVFVIAARRRPQRIRLSRTHFTHEHGRTKKSVPWHEISEIVLVDVPAWKRTRYDAPRVAISLRAPGGYSVGWMDIPDAYTIRHRELAAILKAWQARALKDLGAPKTLGHEEALNVIAKTNSDAVMMAAVYAMVPVAVLLGVLLWLILW
jgi:hypothetical protein